jgi:hypothetical protein
MKINFTRFNKHFKKVTNNFFWNGALRLILETYLEIPIVALIIMKDFDLARFGTSYHESISQAGIIFLIMCCVATPILVSLYLFDNYSKIKREVEWKKIVDRKREKLDPETMDRIFY